MSKYSMHLHVCGGTGCFGFCEKGPISICTGTAPDNVQAIIEEYTT